MRLQTNVTCALQDIIKTRLVKCSVTFAHLEKRQQGAQRAFPIALVGLLNTHCHQGPCHFLAGMLQFQTV